MKVFRTTGAIGAGRAAVSIALAELNRSRLASGTAPAATRPKATNLRVGSPRINDSPPSGRSNKGRMWRLTGVVWAQAWFKRAHPGGIDRTIANSAGSSCPKADMRRLPVFVSSAFDLTAGAGVRDQRGECIQRRSCGIGVGLGRRVEPFIAITDCGMRKPDPAVEPWSAAKTADYRNFHRRRHRRAGDRTRIG